MQMHGFNLRFLRKSKIIPPITCQFEQRPNFNQLIIFPLYVCSGTAPTIRLWNIYQPCRNRIHFNIPDRSKKKWGHSPYYPNQR